MEALTRLLLGEYEILREWRKNLDLLHHPRGSVHRSTLADTYDYPTMTAHHGGEAY